MKLILTRPHKNFDPSLGRLLSAWLELHGIHIGQQHVDYTVEYNDFHHFYDVTLRELPGNKDPRRYWPSTAPTPRRMSEHWDRVVALLRSDGYRVETSPSWCHRDGQRIEAIRLFVYIREFAQDGLKVRADLEALGDWSRATANADPQTDIVYVHVPRHERRPGYVTDTQWHLAIQPDSACASKSEGERRARQVARQIIDAMRAY